MFYDCICVYWKKFQTHRNVTTHTHTHTHLGVAQSEKTTRYLKNILINVSNSIKKLAQVEKLLPTVSSLEGLKQCPFGHAHAHTHTHTFIGSGLNLTREGFLDPVNTSSSGSSSGMPSTSKYFTSLSSSTTISPTSSGIVYVTSINPIPNLPDHKHKLWRKEKYINYVQSHTSGKR